MQADLENNEDKKHFKSRMIKCVHNDDRQERQQDMEKSRAVLLVSSYSPVTRYSETT